MEVVVATIQNNLPLLESAGIIGGLFFTAWSLWIDAKVRRVQNLITITAHHREIWSEIYKNPELKRIIDSKADLENRPITIPERLFTRSLFLHLSAAYQASRTGMFSEPNGLQHDIKKFLRLPIPKQIWNQTEESHNQEFQEFVTNASSCTSNDS